MQERKERPVEEGDASSGISESEFAAFLCLLFRCLIRTKITANVISFLFFQDLDLREGVETSKDEIRTFYLVEEDNAVECKTMPEIAAMPNPRVNLGPIR